MRLATNWTDYSILATGDGLKLERWGSVFLLRPDPQIIWRARTSLQDTPGLHARYLRSSSGGGRWEILRDFAPEWTISYGDKYRFVVSPSGFKHTGLFPEQSCNWDWMSQMILGANRPINVLNLFAYTGGATVACAHAGATVTHIDAAKAMLERCKLNCAQTHIPPDRVRYIADDCAKFVLREQRRGRKYDAIIMDPPSYGRGPGGEMWKLADCLFDFVTQAVKLLSDQPLFVLINSYTTGLAPSVLANILSLTTCARSVESYELALPTEESGVVLPCGNSAVAHFQ